MYVLYATSFPMRRASNVNLQPQQILRLPRNLQVQDCNGNSLICFRQYKEDWTIIRPWSDDKIVISHPPLRKPYSSDLGNDFVLKNTTFHAPAISQNVTKCCPCNEKWQSNFAKYCACHAFLIHRANNVNLQPQQILRLLRKMNPMIDSRHT